MIEYTDAPGHTEYVIHSQLVAGGPHHEAQERFEAFRTAWWPTAIIALVVVAQLAVFGRMCAARRAAT